MGQKQTDVIKTNLDYSIYTIILIIEITKNAFEYVNIIGRGGFGKVWKVLLKKSNKVYAMKEMIKTKIIDKKSELSVKNERNFLSYINHPFIINMHYAFQDSSNLYIILDYVSGGDLRYQLCHHKKFNELQTQFFIACILLSLEYIHTNKIIHRDIKPENLVMDEKGYIKLTDFGIARKQDENTYKDTSGTPGYMAPEVMCGYSHSYTVDYYALGIIGFEFMFGVRPYLGGSRSEIKEKIMAKQVKITYKNMPKNWSTAAVDFINKLIIRKPKKRLGYNGIAEIKVHPWFKNFNWKDLYLNKIESKFIPKKEDNFDYKYCNAIEKLDNKTIKRYEEIAESKIYIDIFKDYYDYNRNNIYESEDSNIYKNPHLIYEIENDIEIEKNKKQNKTYSDGILDIYNTSKNNIDLKQPLRLCSLENTHQNNLNPHTLAYNYIKNIKNSKIVNKLNGLQFTTSINSTNI